MAGYDPVTDTIYGCKMFSMVWWHEKGHREYNKLEDSKELQTYSQFIMLTVIGLLIANLRLWASLFFILYLIINSIEELWSWKYCFDHKKEWIK